MRTDLLARLGEMSVSFEDLIEGHRGRIELLQSRSEFVTGWRWSRMKPPLAELVLGMEGLKTASTLILSTYLLELGRGRGCQGGRHRRVRRK
jgi:hypothetical protein